MRKITVVVCLDDKGGMTFLGKRQSRDRVLIGELIESTNDLIYISEFSLPLFKDYTTRCKVVENPLTDAPDGAVSFIENLPLLPVIDEVEEIMLYKWNRVYPADRKTDIPFNRYYVVRETSFVGSSHDKISKVILRKR